MQPFSKTLKLMGNAFTITAVAPSERDGSKAIEIAVNEISRIESLLTTYQPDSQTNRINQNAGISPVQVDAEVFSLIRRSIAISAITQGAFDISYGGIDKSLWNFEKTMTRLPSKEEALKSVYLINYQNIVLDPDKLTVFLREKGMRIGFGGIGKGYAAECAKNKLCAMGVPSGIINASGDLTAWGHQPCGAPWRIGVTWPDDPQRIFCYLDVTDKAMATSGNYEKFITLNGRRYSHTIDPKTGLPATGIKSVTVLAENAELADAMSTPISVMGVKAGLHLVNQIPGLECIIIDDDNVISTSKNINLKS